VAQNNAPVEPVSALPPSYSTAYLNVIPNVIPASSSSASISSATATVDPAQIDDAVAKAVNSYCSSVEFTSQLRDTVREEVSKEVEKKRPEQNDLINLSKSTESSPLEIQPPTDDLLSSLANTSAYAIYCNACSSAIRGLHYHCDECDRGDYDLCEACTAKGAHCYDRAHWLTKRDILDGKPVVQETGSKAANSRYCNSCVGRKIHCIPFAMERRVTDLLDTGFADEQCVVCQDCKDFDLCIACLRNGEHGHDPRHTFARAHSSIILTKDEEALLARGRNVRHSALCDSCDKSIVGVRHKCIDCPDWDYCSNCIDSAHEVHPGHRFVPIFDNDTVAPFNKRVPLSSVVHSGVYCDGPICEQYGRGSAIRGPRFKCAICPDTDFCATCEASPLNRHNSSHPLIKFKTPIRNVHVTTTDNTNTVMGDIPESETKPKEKAEAVVTATDTATQVQTIADVKPTEEFAAVPEQHNSVEKLEEQTARAEDNVPEVLSATFCGDSIADGTVLPVGQEFSQTWYMKNTGKSSWPVGVTVKFVGGDYMFLKTDADCLNATVTETEVKPGETATFSVNLSATWPANKSYISYWRLTASDGTRFGDNIWCNINVSELSAPVSVTEQQTKEEDHEEDRHSEAYSSESVVDADSVRDDGFKGEKEGFEHAAENMVRSQASSEMVFPKLEVESPVHSLEQLPSPARSVKAEETPVPVSPVSSSSHKTFALSEDGDVEEEVDISSIEGSEGFMTDEEYDVLCASDEEFAEC
jgi:next-to-BRCA1 protein 1